MLSLKYVQLLYSVFTKIEKPNIFDAKSGIGGEKGTDCFFVADVPSRVGRAFRSPSQTTKLLGRTVETILML